MPGSVGVTLLAFLTDFKVVAGGVDIYAPVVSAFLARILALGGEYGFLETCHQIGIFGDAASFTGAKILTPLYPCIEYIENKGWGVLLRGVPVPLYIGTDCTFVPDGIAQVKFYANIRNGQ